VVDAPFRGAQPRARVVPDPEVRIANGDFEAFHWRPDSRALPSTNKPGVVSFVDNQVMHGGRAFIALDIFHGNSPMSHAGSMPAVSVRSAQLLSDEPMGQNRGAETGGAFKILGPVDNRGNVPPAVSNCHQRPLATNDAGVERGEHNSLNVYAGVWAADGGQALDYTDWSLEEVGPLNVLRRPGNPGPPVRNENGSVTLYRGRDFVALEDPGSNFYNVDREAPPLRILPETDPGGPVFARELVSPHGGPFKNSREFTVFFAKW